MIIAAIAPVITKNATRPGHLMIFFIALFS
jgi:hypothetical protein